MSADPTPPEPTVGPLRLLAEALAAGVLVNGLLLAAGVPELAVFSVLAITLVLTGRMGQVLAANRSAIWGDRERPRAANGRTALSILAIFVGVGLAFGGVAWWTAPADVGVVFGELLADAVAGDAVDRRFDAGMGDLLARNFATLGVLWLVGFFVGPPGVLLAIGWNAAIWTASIAGLAADASPAGAAPSVGAIVGTTAALAPHLLLELVAYVLAAMSAIFDSRALSRYHSGDARRWQVFRSVVRLLGVAAALVVAAAVLEDSVAPLLLDRLR